MKNLIIFVIVLCLVFIALLYTDNQVKKYERYGYINVTPYLTVTPLIISRLYKDYVSKYKYINEEKDYIKTPQEFEKDGGGDCEDFALYFAYIINIHTNIKENYIVQINGHVLNKIGLFHYDYGKLTIFVTLSEPARKCYRFTTYKNFIRVVKKYNIRETNKLFSFIGK